MERTMEFLMAYIKLEWENRNRLESEVKLELEKRQQLEAEVETLKTLIVMLLPVRVRDCNWMFAAASGIARVLKLAYKLKSTALAFNKNR